MTMSLNKVQLIGNLTRDPEVRQTPNGTTVATFTIATNRTWKDQSGERQEKVEFHNVVAWGRLAEICQQYLSKGKKVYAEGRLQTRDWEGDDGVKRYKTEIIIENMIMLSPRGQSDNSSYDSDNGNNFSDDDAAQNEPDSDDEEITIDDLPF